MDRKTDIAWTWQHLDTVRPPLQLRIMFDGARRDECTAAIGWCIHTPAIDAPDKLQPLRTGAVYITDDVTALDMELGDLRASLDALGDLLCRLGG